MLSRLYFCVRVVIFFLQLFQPGSSPEEIQRGLYISYVKHCFRMFVVGRFIGVAFPYAESISFGLGGLRATLLGY